jgi:hypothetical protein
MHKTALKAREKYFYGNVDLFDIRNKNEIRVIKLLPEVLAEYPDFKPNVLDIEDIYALSLNKLPARYVQKGSIVLREAVTDDQISQAIREAVGVVQERPNYPEP